MPFNGSGVFSIINTFVPGTTISSAAMNANLSDIASGLTDCLTRDGQAPMTAPLKLINGGVSAPAMAFAGEPTLGLYRKSTGVLGISGSLDVSGGVALNGSSIVPIGVIWPYGGATAPTNFLLCDGSQKSRVTYAALFAVIGTSYGSGDGSTTFNIPDLRGRVPAGKDLTAGRLTSATMTPDGNTLGATGGAQLVALSEAQLPVVTPTFTGTNKAVNVTSSSSGDTTIVHAASHGGINSSAGTSAEALGFNTVSISGVASSGAYLPEGAISPFGSGAAHNNVQPTIITNYIIYAGA